MKKRKKSKNKMTRTRNEIEKEIQKRKFSKSVICYGHDKLHDLLVEIYCDGMREGYEFAKSRLDSVYSMPTQEGHSYIDENIANIKATLKLCEEYNKCEE